MPRKNTFISELKTIISSSNYSYDDVPEEVIPIFVSFFENLTDLRHGLFCLSVARVPGVDDRCLHWKPPCIWFVSVF